MAASLSSPLSPDPAKTLPAPEDLQSAQSYEYCTALYRHLRSTVASLPLDPEIAGNVFGGRASRLKSIFYWNPWWMESF